MTGYLLDTHVWLWAVGDSPRLPRSLRRTIDRSSADCHLSPMSIWELGLLVSSGRLRIDQPLRRWLDEGRERYPTREAPVTDEVALTVNEIALPTRDPVDGFLAATALVYGLTLMTVDEDLIGLDWLPTLSGR